MQKISPQFEEFISRLSRKGKSDLFYTLSKKIVGSFPGIEKTKAVCSGSACIIRTRIPVWTIISYKKQGLSNTELLNVYPMLRNQDLKNAVEYYKSNKKEIDLDIYQNNFS